MPSNSKMGHIGESKIFLKKDYCTHLRENTLLLKLVKISIYSTKNFRYANIAEK